MSTPLTTFASVFLGNLHYFYANPDGTYNWPKGVVGDLLRRAKVEIESKARLIQAMEDLIQENESLRKVTKEAVAGPSSITLNARAALEVASQE
jgi:hypothetical protein